MCRLQSLLHFCSCFCYFLESLVSGSRALLTWELELWEGREVSSTVEPLQFGHLLSQTLLVFRACVHQSAADPARPDAKRRFSLAAKPSQRSHFGPGLMCTDAYRLLVEYWRMESRKSLWMGSSAAEGSKQEVCVQAQSRQKGSTEAEPSCTNSVATQTFCHRGKEGSKVSQQAV